MVDNIAVTAGTGTTIAADDIGAGVLAQRVKPVWGPDGTGNDIDVASGKPLPTQLRSPIGVDLTGSAGTASAAVLTVQGIASGTAQPVTGTITAVTAITNALPVGANVIGKTSIDQTTDGTTNKVAANVYVGGAVADKGSGTGGSATLRVIPDSTAIITKGTAGAAAVDVLSVQGIAGAVPQTVGGVTVTQSASSTITRPADTTAYASGDLVANSVTAGSVVNLQFTTLARVSGGSGVIIGAQIQKSGPTITNAAFRLHLFNTAPTYTSAGDNSALATVVVASAKGYLGYIDITAMVGFSDVGWGSGAPDNSRGGIPYVATAQIIYGLLEARGAYTPISAEVFTITVDALQD